VISSYELKKTGDEREYHLFVAEPEKLDRLFAPIKQETKYIDLLLPEPLLYKPLYTKEILNSDNTHCFIYFTQYDASITIYENGEYLYTKSIEFSLEQIYDRYCGYVGEKVEQSEFFKILESEGLKTTNEYYQQNFMKIFGEVFITINDIINYVKRAFNLEGIDQVFIGSERGTINGLDDYSKNYLGLHSSEFNFNYNVNSDKWYIDQHQYLMLLSSLEYLEDESSFVNLTMYPRPPSFAKRTSGQIIILTLAAVTLSLAMPLYQLGASYFNDFKISGLKDEDRRLATEANKYKKILSKKESEIKALDATIKNASNAYDGKIKTLKTIYDKKVNYKLKSGLFNVIAGELAQFDLGVDKMASEGDTLYISLVSQDDRKFTELIEYISNTHFNDIEEINIEHIKKDPKSNYYKGLLKVVR